MRLIDADAVVAMTATCPKEMDIDSFIEGMGVVLDRVYDAPTVDAVRVVRCKDCKWWKKKDDSQYGYCMAMKHGFVSSHWEIGIYRTYKGDFYCADGERRENDVSD